MPWFRKPTRIRDFNGVFTLYRAHTPQLFVDIDRTKVESLQVPLQDVFTTLQVYMGGLYVNQFNEFGRTWQVQVQAEPRFRTSTGVIKQFQVRNNQGQMMPLGTLARVKDNDRAASGHALQHVHLGIDQRLVGPRRQHRHDDRHDGAIRQRNRRAVRVDATHVSSSGGRQRRVLDLRSGNGARLFHIGREV